MAINFPINPTPNQIYSYNGLSWQWNGSYWQSFPPSSGATGVVRTITASTGLSANTNTGDVTLIVTGSTGGGTFTGGTITGATSFTGGLSANTISATTYNNYPGSSSSYCVPTFYVSSISGCSPVNILTPLYVTNGLNVTGSTNFTQSVDFTGGLTANTISATTITPINLNTTNITGTTISATTITPINLNATNITGTTISATTITPINLNATNITGGTISASTYNNAPFVTGGTYTSGTITFNDAKGGTFSVTGLPVGGQGGQLYYFNTSVTQSPYKEFGPTGTTASEQSTTISVASGVTSTVQSYLTPIGYPNSLIFPGGVWSFYLHTYKQDSSSSFNIYCDIYKRTSGEVETYLFSTDPSQVTATGLTSTMVLTDDYYSGTTLNVSDRILVLVKATNTGTSTKQITFITEGTTRYSYGITTFNGIPANVSSLTASDGISGNSTTGAVSIVNTDKGSSQNIFKNIQINGNTQFSAGSNSSNLNFSGINITITSAATNTLVFSASTGNVTSVTAGAGLSGNSTTGAITLINTGVTRIIAGTNITISPTGGTGNVTITSTGGGASLGLVYTTGNNLNFI